MVWSRAEVGTPMDLLQAPKRADPNIVSKAYLLNVASDDTRNEERFVQLYHTELSKRLEKYGDTPPTFDALRAPLGHGPAQEEVQK